jgi:hypothetical protein
MEQETGNNEGELHESHGVKLDFKMFNHQQNLQAFAVCTVEHLKPNMPLALYASIPVGNDHHAPFQNFIRNVLAPSSCLCKVPIISCRSRRR